MKVIFKKNSHFFLKKLRSENQNRFEAAKFILGKTKLPLWNDVRISPTSILICEIKIFENKVIFEKKFTIFF